MGRSLAQAGQPPGPAHGAAARGGKRAALHPAAGRRQDAAEGERSTTVTAQEVRRFQKHAQERTSGNLRTGQLVETWRKGD